MGIYHAPDGRYYLCENKVEVNGQSGELRWSWRYYEDFKDPIRLPKYVPAVTQGTVAALSAYTQEYDYVAQLGHQNIGAWIDTAAAQAGR